MKKLLNLIILLGLAAGGGYFWYQQSIYFVLVELDHAVAAKDVPTIEKYVDLDAIAKNTLDFAQATTEVAAEKAAGSLGASLVKGLAGLIRSDAGVDKKLTPELKDEIRATIAEGEAQELLGPFEPRRGFDAVAEIIAPEKGLRQVVFVGTCEGKEARAVVDFVRVPKGPMDFFGTWKATGMSEAAMKDLARTCLEGAAENRGKKGANKTDDAAAR